MSFLWDLIQQSEIDANARKADAARVKSHKNAMRLKAVEDELTATRTLLTEVVRRLEIKFGEDINKDGNIG